LVVAGAFVWAVVYKRQQSLRLKRRFGPEYNRAVDQLGGESQAEAELRKRETRVAKLKIRSLTAEEAARFRQAWSRVQGQFVDAPHEAVAEADELVRELMTTRGYPMGDFEHRAADISVDHPTVVTAYRAAQLIALKDTRGAADTEELRKAMVHYRTLFAELLEAVPMSEGSKQHGVTVQS
ncbi:MAG: hypothetical protein JO184_13685, partial [Gammaproteobacteria bacterium]|nr:hypothetical protein [Gammaproteobacteria bacterium]